MLVQTVEELNQRVHVTIVESKATLPEIIQLQREVGGERLLLGSVVRMATLRPPVGASKGDRANRFLSPTTEGGGE